MNFSITKFEVATSSRQTMDRLWYEINIPFFYNEKNGYNDKLAQRRAVDLLEESKTGDQRVASSRLNGVTVLSVMSLSKTLYLLRSTVLTQE